MTRAAPIVRITGAWAAGVAAGLAGAPLWIAPLLAGVGAAAPDRSFRRPAGIRPSLLALVAAGGLLAGGADRSDGLRCAVEPGTRAHVEGHFLAGPRSGSAPFRTVDGCGPFTVVVASGEGRGLRGGDAVRVTGVWRAGQVRPWLRAERVRPLRPNGAGRGLAGVLEPLHPGEARWLAVRWRDGLVDRSNRLFGRNGPLVAGLVLARREGLDRDLRDAFAEAGIAHLLAISGFHVGLVAALVFSLLRARDRSRRQAAAASAAIAWVYVAFIGFPAAACRAALLLSAAAGARARGHPTSRWGPLASAAFLLLLADPSLLASAGFQLSFAGAAGLLAWAGPAQRSLGRAGSAIRTRMGGAPAGGGTSGLVSATAAGIAATLATLPIVAWHFERVSVVGIPVTLLATPIVSLALPGALASLALDFVWPDGASFLGGGVSWLLDLLTELTRFASGLPWSTAWLDRPTVLVGCLGVGAAMVHARRPGIGGGARRRLSVLYAVSALVAWPLLVQLDGRGRLELVFIDVGQGDATALRAPGGRWWLVDAGPPPRGEAGTHPAVRALRRRGVRRLDALVLTHPDADHIGGAPAVLDHVPPRLVIDPMMPTPKPAYAGLLDEALRRGIPWRAARTGDRYEVNGVAIEVLHPAEGFDPGDESNAVSVVLRISWGSFSALLTGDAYVDVERSIASEVGDIDVLKVGHHGSRTSTDATFLSKSRPEVAVISAGRGNRYGHPAPAVLTRLEAAGAVVRRTDREGSLRLVVRRDGSYTVTAR